MKNFLKMMLVMGLMALTVSGCNIFGNDDDDDGKEIYGTWIFIDGDASETLVFSETFITSTIVRTKGTPYSFEVSASIT